MADSSTPTDPAPSGPSLPGPLLARLLDAIGAVGSDLDLPTVLRHLVESAVALAGAEAGALGVVDPDEADGALSRFVTVGVERAAAAPLHGLDELTELLEVSPAVCLADADAHRDAVGPPPSPIRTGHVLGVPVRAGDAVYGHLYVTDKRDGQDFTAVDEQVVSALAVAAGVAIHNARLYEQARRGSAWREAGRAVSTALLSAADRQDVIALLAETARDVLSADSVLIVLVGGEGPRVAATIGEPGPAQDQALLDGLQLVLTDGEPAAAESGGRHGFTVPLGPAGQPCRGALVALWTTPPSPLLVDDLKGFTAQAAVAIELADRRHDAEQGAVMADRDRIGRDLHDLVIQRLFATGMRLQGAVRLIDDDPDRARARVDLAVDDLDATIRELRSTIHGLQAPVDGLPSLRARLLEVVDAGTTQLGFAPSMRLDGLLDTVVPAAVAEHVVATVREALSNAARHAGATQVEVTVVLRDGFLSVVVEDDGTGTADGAARSGLLNLGHRASDVGGALTLDAGRLGGTRLTWRVPVQTEG